MRFDMLLPKSSIAGDTATAVLPIWWVLETPCESATAILIRRQEICYVPGLCWMYVSTAEVSYE